MIRIKNSYPRFLLKLSLAGVLLKEPPLSGGANQVPGRDFHPQSSSAFPRRTCYRDLSSIDNEWPIILANTCSRLKNSISHRRLFVSKSLHGIDLCRVAGGNVAGDECDCHQER